MNDGMIDAFHHNVWATRMLIEAFRNLSAEHLARPARGFGSILETFNHIVSSDAAYAAQLGGVRPAWASDGNEAPDLDQLAVRVDETGHMWAELLSVPVDAERLPVLEEGAYEVHAGVVVAQALHHANVHREQIRSSLADLGYTAARPAALGICRCNGAEVLAECWEVTLRPAVRVD
ncbi:MAG TPA: DinB family protein [Candidatus Kapabacteria bacterium]|nr:DinB family protein [Candidatus Kapabacteria bacterium]